MKLKYITLENFRSYYGEHNIEFACEENKQVTIFHGAMGAGKTKIFGAIQWCLYGQEEYEEVASNKMLVNSLARKEAGDSGKEIKTEVKVVFEHDDKIYNAVRKFSCFGEEVEEKSGFTLVQSEPNGDYCRLDDPELEINGILPHNLRQYFMFDGEKIQNYSKIGHEVEIKNAIKGLLGFEDIEGLIKTLKKIDSDYDRDIKNTTTSLELQHVIENIEKTKTAIETNDNNIQACEKEISKGSISIEKLNKELAGLEKAEEYIKEEEKLNGKLITLEADAKALRDSITSDSDQIYLTMLDDVCLKIDQTYRSLEESGKIPAPIRSEFIRKKLEEESCICGRGLKKGADDEAIKAMTSFLSAETSEIENLVSSIPLDLQQLRYRSEFVKRDLLTKSTNLHKIEEEQHELIAEIRKISEYLKNSDQEDIATRQEQKLNLEKALDDKKSERDRLNYDNDQHEEKLRELENQKNKLSDQQNIMKELRQYQGYADELKKYLEEFYKIYESDTKEKVRKATEDTFKRFMWKKDHYRKVVIEEDYVLDVFDRNDRRAREGLSAGERQCFSLAFVIALANVTEKHAPFIVDTPLGRISRDPGELVDPRVQILKAIPELLGQVILFVTYEEVRPGEDTERAISSNVGAEYKLEYDKSNGCTKIEKLK